jgi:hypothetical protein
MPTTYEPIATQTLSSATSSVTFSAIASTYTDLIVVCNNLFVASGTPNLRVQFNSDTGANYSVTVLEDFQNTVYSRRQSSITGIDYGYYNYIYPTSTSTAPNSAIIQIMNYSNTTTNKTAIARVNNTYSGPITGVGLWRNTSAITSVTVTNSSYVNFTVGSIFTLYGIKAA